MNDVLLTETETLFILSLNSNIISQENHAEYSSTYEKNQIYMEVKKN